MFPESKFVKVGFLVRRAPVRGSDDSRVEGLPVLHSQLRQEKEWKQGRKMKTTNNTMECGVTKQEESRSICKKTSPICESLRAGSRWMEEGRYNASDSIEFVEDRKIRGGEKTPHGVSLTCGSGRWGSTMTPRDTSTDEQQAMTRSKLRLEAGSENREANDLGRKW